MSFLGRNLSDLVPNKRYLIYQYNYKFNKTVDKNILIGIKQFRGNFVQIIDINTIEFQARLSKDTVTFYKESFTTIPKSWIFGFKTLDDITYRKLNLPIELIDKIDSYV
jgi:hypothetical protein